jgi:hypothetical protein
VRHVTAAMAIRPRSSAAISADRYARDGYGNDGEPTLPPLTKRWPRMNERGIEWTEVTAPATHSAMRVIRILRPSPR